MKFHYRNSFSLPLPFSISQNPEKDQALAALPSVAALSTFVQLKLMIGGLKRFSMIWRLAKDHDFICMTSKPMGLSRTQKLELNSLKRQKIL